ncbi:hypothetical protein SCYAM73S_01258 [Streptomyces cyaneofuscatus]
MRGARPAAAELEAVAVALEGGVVPAVDPVPVRPTALDPDRAGPLPEVDAVVGVVVEPRADDLVSGAGAELDGEAVGVLAVVPGVVVAVRVQVLDQVVRRALAAQREAGVAVAVGGEVAEDPAGGRGHDDAVGAGVAERQVRQGPVVAAYRDQPLPLRQLGPVDDRLLRPVGGDGDAALRGPVRLALEALGGVVRTAAQLDGGAGARGGERLLQLGRGGDDDGLGGARVIGGRGRPDAHTPRRDGDGHGGRERTGPAVSSSAGAHVGWFLRSVGSAGVGGAGRCLARVPWLPPLAERLPGRERKE